MPKRHHAPPQPSPHVLLVGDPQFHRGLVAVVLRRLGYRVSWRASAAEALAQEADRPQAERAALLGVALRLPDLDGLSFIERWRSLGGPAAAAPVLVVGDEHEIDARAEALAGAELAGSFAKPVPIARYLDLIRQRTRGAMNGETETDDALKLDVDMNRLDSFTGGDAALEAELVDLYIATARRYVLEMRDAQEAGQSWSAQAHSLKGASANFGAPAVARLALVAEKKGGDDKTLDALDQKLDAVEAFFRDRLRAAKTLEAR